MTDITIENDGKLLLVDEVLSNTCRYKNVLLEEAIVTVQNGADTIRKIEKLTEVGIVYKRCHSILQNVLDHQK